MSAYRKPRDFKADGVSARCFIDKDEKPHLPRIVIECDSFDWYAADQLQTWLFHATRWMFEKKRGALK